MLIKIFEIFMLYYIINFFRNIFQTFSNPRSKTSLFPKLFLLESFLIKRLFKILIAVFVTLKLMGFDYEEFEMRRTNILGQWTDLFYRRILFDCGIHLKPQNLLLKYI